MCSGIYRKCIRIIGRFVLIGDLTILLSIEILSVWRSYFQFFYLNLMNYSFDDSHVEMNYQWRYIYRQALFFYKEVNIRSTSTYGKIRNIFIVIMILNYRHSNKLIYLFLHCCLHFLDKFVDLFSQGKNQFCFISYIS